MIRKHLLLSEDDDDLDFVGDDDLDSSHKKGENVKRGRSLEYFTKLNLPIYVYLYDT